MENICKFETSGWKCLYKSCVEIDACFLSLWAYFCGDNKKSKSFYVIFSAFRRLRRADLMYVYHCTLAFESSDEKGDQPLVKLLKCFTDHQ